MIAVLAKNLLQHGLAFVFGGFLLLACVVTGWALVLGQELPTLFSAATGVIYYVGPLFIFFIVERLVAVDRIDGTSEFLGALPLRGWHRLLLPWLLGLLVVGVTFELGVLSTALLASRREGLPFGWFVQVHGQVALFTLGWYAMAFAVASLGRYRWLFWWCFLVLFAELDGVWVDSVWRSWLWTAPLADPLEQTRSVPPWDALLPVGVWTSMGIAASLFLENWRGGALPLRWYTPATARQRAAIVVAGILAVGFVAVPTALAPPDDAWSTIEPVAAKHAEIRVASRSLEPFAEEAARQLDAIGDLAGVDRFAGVVLHPTRARGRHVRFGAGTDRNLVVFVDPTGPRASIVRDIVHMALFNHTGGLADEIPGADAFLAGLPGVLAPDPVFAERLTYAIEPTATYAEVLFDWGPDLAEAVAVQRVGALSTEDRASWARALLQTEKSSGVPDLLALRWGARGLSEALKTPVSTGRKPGIPTPEVVIGDGVAVRVVGDGQLEWSLLDPLRERPRPSAQLRRETIDGELVSIAADEAQPMAVRQTRYVPAIEGWLASPWRIR